MSRQLRFVIPVALALGFAMPGMALAHPGHGDDEGVLDSGTEVHGILHDNHGGLEGHLPPSQENVELIARLPVFRNTPGRVSDVGVLGDVAYLGAFNEPDCQAGGVYVFDLSDLARPKRIFIPAAPDTYVGEGVHAIRLDTPHFSGDLLVHNNEICGTNPAAQGGVTLIDVTNPREYEFLARGVGDFGDPPGPRAHQSHSAFAWTQETAEGQKAYVVMVDNEETEDVDILDITDPRNPVLIAEYDLNTEFPQIIQPELGTAESFHHDVVVKEIDGRMVALISYWDGGYVQLDVTDPTAATYIADTDFPFPDPEAAESGLTVDPEGNAHQSEFSKDSDFIVAADEDFSPYSVVATNTTDGTEFDATQGSDVPQIDGDTSLSGTTVYVGLACNDSDPVPPASGEATIALVERGVCAFTEKLANVEAAGGYEGMIVFNREGADGCSSLLTMLVEGNIPALFVGRDVGFDLLNLPYDEDACRAGDGTATAPAAIGTVGDAVSIVAIFDGWGYVHLYANGTGKLTELDTYAIPEAHDPAFASGFGDLSVHEVAMSHRNNELAYFSYYSGGFRVAQIQGDELVEVGHFIGDEGNNFWGVQVWEKDGKEYVLASDRDFGLYIFEYTGPGNPNA